MLNAVIIPSFIGQSRSRGDNEHIPGRQNLAIPNCAHFFSPPGELLKKEFLRNIYRSRCSSIVHGRSHAVSNRANNLRGINNDRIITLNSRARGMIWYDRESCIIASTLEKHRINRDDRPAKILILLNDEPASSRPDSFSIPLSSRAVSPVP